MVRRYEYIWSRISGGRGRLVWGLDLDFGFCLDADFASACGRKPRDELRAGGGCG